MRWNRDWSAYLFASKRKDGDVCGIVQTDVHANASQNAVEQGLACISVIDTGMTGPRRPDLYKCKLFCLFA